MKALILGSTGNVGSKLLLNLLTKDKYTQIVCIVRKMPEVADFNISTKEKNKLLYVEVSDFDKLKDFQSYFNVDDVFCCLGTTMKNAGSKAAFEKVDYEYVVKAAKMSQFDALRFFFVSSMGANPHSFNFYLRTKGKTEMALLQTTLATIYILRPGFILGERSNNNGQKTLAHSFIKLLRPIMVWKLKNLRGIHVDDLGNAMCKLSDREEKGRFIYENEHLENLAKGKKMSTNLNAPSI